MLIRNYLTAVLLCFGLVLSRPGNSAGSVSSAVTVSGAVSSPMTYSATQLEQFPVHNITFKAAEGDRQYTGALLRDVLIASKPTEPDPLALRQSYVVATGTDNYLAVFSWAELFISPIGDAVIIVYKRDGTTLNDDEGRIAIVSQMDLKPGPRYVKWLKSIEIRRVVH